MKRSLADCPEEVPIKVNVLKTPATLSSTSLDGSQVPCCPLAGMLPSIKRQMRFGTPFKKAIDSSKSPVLEERNYIPNIQIPVPRNPSRFPPQFDPKNSPSIPERKRSAVPVSIWASRRNSCMRKLPVRRNYHLVKVENLGCPPIPEVHTRSLRSI